MNFSNFYSLLKNSGSLARWTKLELDGNFQLSLAYLGLQGSFYVGS